MNNKRLLTITSIIASSAVVFHVARAQDDGAATEEDGASEVGQLDEYWEHVAANDAAAEAWLAAHPKGVGDELSDDEQLVEGNYGCPDGTQFWQRDRVMDICATLCASDLDCGPEEGRCRVVDFGARDHQLDIAIVDDLPAEEVDAWMEAVDPLVPPVMMCDPFFDVDGALDADLVEGVEGVDETP